MGDIQKEEGDEMGKRYPGGSAEAEAEVVKKGEGRGTRGLTNKR